MVRPQRVRERDADHLIIIMMMILIMIIMMMIIMMMIIMIVIMNEYLRPSQLMPQMEARSAGSSIKAAIMKER